MFPEGGADFLVCAADGHGGDAEELAEEVHGGELALVEHGGQDPVGWSEFGFGSCAGGHQALMASTDAECPFALQFQLG
ncbi:hypothetical protein GCM10020000_84000 [Streptomyces olivoverticillatus]